MVAEISPHPQTESLFAAISRWARHAPPRVLTDLVAFGLAVAVLSAAINWRLPIAPAALAVGAVGGWGLVSQYPSSRHPRWHAGLGRVLAGAWMLAATAAVVMAMFWAMGPAPKL
jgi:hypothetical protein